MAFGAQRLGEAIAVALYLLPGLAIVIIMLARYMRRGQARMSKVAIETDARRGARRTGSCVILLVLVLFPFYWMTITSFKNEDQMRSLVSMFWPSPSR